MTGMNRRVVDEGFDREFVENPAVVILRAVQCLPGEKDRDGTTGHHRFGERAAG